MHAPARQQKQGILKVVTGKQLMASGWANTGFFDASSESCGMLTTHHTCQLCMISGHYKLTHCAQQCCS
jgi:hypothetical protein